MQNIILTIGGLILGMGLGYWIRRLVALKKAATAEAQVEEIIKSAKNKQQELLFNAREEAMKVIDEAKREEISRRKELRALTDRLEKRESLFDKKLLELEEKQQQLSEKASKLEEIKSRIRELHEEAIAKLEEISGMTEEEAINFLLEKIEKDNQEVILERLKKVERAGSDLYEKKAREVMSLAMERIATSHATERTTSTVNISSDDLKGRIIGREGRNIKAIEQLTGVEIIVDDTPGAIFISGFNPIRRQLAKMVLEKLILDGRIQPARIEKVVEDAKKELVQDIRSAGEDAAYQVGITGLDPKLVTLIGRLKYRTSYGQNVLQHSIEVANLSEILATELGADEFVAKKAGFFHDIGKAVDHEVEGTHPAIGQDLMKKFGFPEKIIIPIATHHEDHPPTLEAVIVKVADALSASRLGARKDNYEDFIKRLEDLEGVAKSFAGVEKVYAIQAGRELRVFVVPQEINDLEAAKLARQIADRIEAELKYPGEIKVTVIRENRIIEFAR
ncbi:MAG: ribonuclease Y [Patescibacteria group bacterium]